MADDRIDERIPLIFPSSSIPPPVDNRTDFQRKLAVWFILSAVVFERLAFYSLAGNLVLFLSSDSIKWSLVHSVGGSLFFFGASYISALIFSWISDARVGRGKTILVGFAFYIVGYIFIPLFSKEKIFEKLCHGIPKPIHEEEPYGNEICSAQITTALVVTAIGAGAVQANMAVFGAEQVREQTDTTRYFNKYYAAVNIGSLLAFGVMSYVQLNIDWYLGHLVSAIFLGVTFFIFVIGYRFYFHMKLYDSVITNFFPVFINALRTWRKYRRHEQQTMNRHRSSTKPILFGEEDDEPRKTIDRWSDRNQQSISFLDNAKIANHGRFSNRIVEDIKAFRPIMVVFLLLIPYWTIYLQTGTTFVMQAVHMRVPHIPVIKQSKSMPVVWLSLADQLVIIVSIFILNTCVYKHLHTKNKRLSLKVRIVIGMIFAALSMCATGIVEIHRQERCNITQESQEIGNTNYNHTDMSVFYQFPQYLTIGLSEVFTSVASMEFAYLAAPQSAQSLVMSLRFASIGISSLLGSGYISIFKLVNKNYGMKNDECLDVDKPYLFYTYFFVLAGIQLLFICVFLVCDRKFHILKVSQHRFNTRLFIGSSSRTSNT